jgi:hypothetical protein
VQPCAPMGGGGGVGGGALPARQGEQEGPSSVSYSVGT